MSFCNMHGIVCRYNVSNGTKSTYTGINAKNPNGLIEKVTGPVSKSVQLIVIKCNMQLLRQRGRKIVRFTGHCLLFKVELTIKYRETNIVVNQHLVGDDITSQS